MSISKQQYQIRTLGLYQEAERLIDLMDREERFGSPIPEAMQMDIQIISEAAERLLTYKWKDV